MKKIKTEPETVKPLPCPFCGGPSAIFRIGIGGQVRCLNLTGCNARIESSVGLVAALERWNRRKVELSH